MTSVLLGDIEGKTKSVFFEPEEGLFGLQEWDKNEKKTKVCTTLPSSLLLQFKASMFVSTFRIFPLPDLILRLLDC